MTPAHAASNASQGFKREGCLHDDQSKTGNNRLRGGLPKDWKIGDKTGNNGKDASDDIAVAWPKVGGPLLICAYTQGGSPTPPQFEAIFAEVGRMVGRKMG